MEKDRIEYDHQVSRFGIERIKAELSELDRQMVDADGIQLKPSQCYHFESSPLHVLFNTNCPDALRQKVEDIISRHINDSFTHPFKE
jgi:hypothetical protein